MSSVDYDYMLRYVVNKNAYYNLCSLQSGGKKKENYYVLHSTNMENLLDILKTGKVLANKYIDPQKRRMSGDTETKYVFANLIQRKYMDVPNFGMGLIFDKKILRSEHFLFNPSWYAAPYEKSIKFFPDDPKFNSKLKKVFDLITSPYPHKHELLFEDSIDLKYLIGIHCPICTLEQLNEIRKIVGYQIPIYFTHNIPILE